MARPSNDDLDPELPVAEVDSPGLPRPDDVDTVSPGVLDESGELPHHDATRPPSGGEVAEPSTNEPTG